MSDEETSETSVNDKSSKAASASPVSRTKLIAQLIAAAIALAGAVERYIDLQTKGELVYEALASKVNNMAEELARVQGQNDVILQLLARGGSGVTTERDLRHARGPASVSPDVEEAAAVENYSGETTVEAETSSLEPLNRKRVTIPAYQALPADLDGLVQQVGR